MIARYAECSNHERRPSAKAVNKVLHGEAIASHARAGEVIDNGPRETDNLGRKGQEHALYESLRRPAFLILSAHGG